MDNQNAGQFNPMNPANPAPPEYKMPEAKKESSGGLGPIIGLIIIIGIILIGGIYYFSKTINTGSQAERNGQNAETAGSGVTNESAVSEGAGNELQNIQTDIDGLKDESIDQIGEDIF